jgi:hypothetical protein
VQGILVFAALLGLARAQVPAMPPVRTVDLSGGSSQVVSGSTSTSQRTVWVKVIPSAAFVSPRTHSIELTLVDTGGGLHRASVAPCFVPNEAVFERLPTELPGRFRPQSCQVDDSSCTFSLSTCGGPRARPPFYWVEGARLNSLVSVLSLLHPVC